MKAIQLSAFVKGPSDLQLSHDVPAPQPKADQYTISIQATSTNFFDLLQISGKYQHQPPFPFIPGAEFAGTITAVPSQPSLSNINTQPRFAVGDRVFGSAQGSYAEVICATESQLRPIPNGWSFEQGAALCSAMATAYAALVTRAQIKKGEWVLVHAAAGGVGLAAVQIAKALGATVIATAGSQHKLDVAKRFGADYVINYVENEKWAEEVQRLTPRKRGVDIVFDPVGLIATSMKCIAFSGRLVVIGFVSGSWENIATNRILLKNISVMGLHWGAYSRFDTEEIERVWKGLFELFEAGKVKASVFDERTFVGLEAVPKALECLGGRESWGKVVVRVPQNEEGEGEGEQGIEGVGYMGSKL